MNGNGWGEGRWDTFPSGDGAPSVAASGGTPSDDGFDDVFHPSRHEGLLENGQTLIQTKDPFVFEQEPQSDEEKKVDGETKHDEMADHLDFEVKERTLEFNELKSHYIDEKAVVRSPVTDSVSQIWSSGMEVIKSKIASKGIGFWTMTTLFGLVGILSYMRKRDKRERELLMILLHEKDQRYVEALLYGIGEYLGSISEEELMKQFF
ncbi:uncharacterized protein LOC144559645 isoform X2 [Carex rostrata]